MHGLVDAVPQEGQEIHGRQRNGRIRMENKKSGSKRKVGINWSIRGKYFGQVSQGRFFLLTQSKHDIRH